MVIEGGRFKFHFLQEEVRQKDPEYKLTCCKLAASLLILTGGHNQGFKIICDSETKDN